MLSGFGRLAAKVHVIGERADCAAAPAAAAPCAPPPTLSAASVLQRDSLARPFLFVLNMLFQPGTFNLCILIENLCILQAAGGGRCDSEEKDCQQLTLEALVRLMNFVP